MYSEKNMDDLVNRMIEFLRTHKIYELMELVTAAIATREED